MVYLDSLLNEGNSIIEGNEFLLSSGKYYVHVSEFYNEQLKLANYYNDAEKISYLAELNSLLSQFPKCISPTEGCASEHKDWVKRVLDFLSNFKPSIPSQVFPFSPDIKSIIAFSLVALGIYLVFRK